MVLNYLLTIGIVGAIVIGGKRYYDANIKARSLMTLLKKKIRVPISI